MSVTVSRRSIEPRHALVIRRRTTVEQIGAELAELLPRVRAHAQRAGLAIAGPPFARYVVMNRERLEIEAGLPIATPGTAVDDLLAIELPGGPAAVAIHEGPYERLRETHAAIEAWLEAQKLITGGAPWETYLTDPGDHPDPKDWRTEIVYPLAS